MVFCFWVSHELSVMCALPQKMSLARVETEKKLYMERRDKQMTIHLAFTE